jgi:hypothetical protein
MLVRAREYLQGMEEAANWINDMDREWWPFQFLRPEQHAKMSSLRVAVLAILYGVMAGMFANVIVAIGSGGTPDSLSVVTLPGYTTLAFFAVYRTTFAFFWNRRAERLAAERVR